MSGCNLLFGSLSPISRALSPTSGGSSGKAVSILGLGARGRPGGIAHSARLGVKIKDISLGVVVLAQSGGSIVPYVALPGRLALTGKGRRLHDIIAVGYCHLFFLNEGIVSMTSTVTIPDWLLYRFFVIIFCQVWLQ